MGSGPLSPWARGTSRRSPIVCLGLGLAGLVLAPFAPASRAAEIPFGPRTSIATLPGFTVVGVEVADVDGDGDADAIAASPLDPDTLEAGTLAWYPNQDGQGSFGGAHTIAQGLALDFVVADLDGDADPDVVEGTLLNSVLWHENAAGNGTTWTQRTVANVAALPSDAADVDGDGNTDVVSTNNGVNWHESDGASPPVFTSHLFVGTAGYEHAVAAFVDGDTNRDLLAVEPGFEGFPQNPPPILAWLESDGATPPGFTPHTLDNTGDCPAPAGPEGLLRCSWVRGVDLDEDGDVDAILADGGTLEVSWYENDGGSPPGFTKRLVATNARVGRPADVDGDGDLDVLAESGGEIVWIDNDGATPPGWTPRSIGSAGGFTHDIEAADVDGDGDLDVLIAAGSEIAWFQNRRPPGFSVPALSPVSRSLLVGGLVGLAVAATRRLRPARAGA